MDAIKETGTQPRMIGDNIDPVESLYSNLGMDTVNRTKDDEVVLMYSNPGTKNET